MFLRFCEHGTLFDHDILSGFRMVLDPTAFTGVSGFRTLLAPTAFTGVSGFRTLLAPTAFTGASGCDTGGVDTSGFRTLLVLTAFIGVSDVGGGTVGVGASVDVMVGVIEAIGFGTLLGFADGTTWTSGFGVLLVIPVVIGFTIGVTGLL